MIYQQFKLTVWRRVGSTPLLGLELNQHTAAGRMYRINGLEENVTRVESILLKIRCVKDQVCQLMEVTIVNKGYKEL
jgi:hypothetical protein